MWRGVIFAKIRVFDPAIRARIAMPEIQLSHKMGMGVSAPISCSQLWQTGGNSNSPMALPIC
ncbi:MAG: hypothetical protein R3C26_15360 [Calditrichia bacterium]